jgi:RNA polymerase sigma factor (TIGR02999 family)
MEPAPPQHEVTRLLHEWKRGDQDALASLAPLVESELKRLAGAYMRSERSGHTLQPTALVNEAWLRLSNQNQPEYADRSHFVAVAAHYMRQILVDHARRKQAGKRGESPNHVPIDDAVIAAAERSWDLIALDEALQELARVDERQSRVIELHFFGGLTMEEIADFLKISRSTAVRDMRMAQLWLKKFVAA